MRNLAVFFVFFGFAQGAIAQSIPVDCPSYPHCPDLAVCTCYLQDGSLHRDARGLVQTHMVFSYDERGHLVRQTVSLEAGDEIVFAYAYDEFGNRLTEAIDWDGDGNQDEMESNV